MGEVTKAAFFRKARDVRELLSDDRKALPIKVVKVIELSSAEYSYFSSHLLEDAPFVAANRDLMARDSSTGITCCLLITAQSARDGILVDSQGYDYAKYAAYVQDKGGLDLRDVPVDHYNQKLRERQNGRDR